MAHTSSTDAPQLTRAELVGTLAGMLLSILLAALDQTIVGTAMPRIIAQLHGFERYAWVTAAYLVGSTVSLPIFARLSDLYGRKRLFMNGVLVFIGASALCGTAGEFPWMPVDGMNQLIAFRALQGVGGGMITGLVFTIIGDIFSPAERGKYQGLFAALFGIASIVGPALGGWITDNLSWRWTFYVNLPVGLIAYIVLSHEFPDVPPVLKRPPRVDWLGAVLLCAWLIPLLVALTFAGRHGWMSAPIVSALLFSAVMLAAFLRNETQAADPLLPLSLIRDSVILVSALEMFLVAAAMFGVVIYLPLFVQAVLGASATRSGSVLSPMMLGSVVMSIVSGQVLARTERYRAIALSGCAVMLCGAALLAQMDETTSMTTVLRNSLLTGLGAGLLQPVFTLAIQHVAPRGQMGAATAAGQFSRAIGGTVGVAVFGSVLLAVYHAALDPQLADTFQNPLRFQTAAPDAVKAALAGALRFVFGCAGGLLVVALGLSLFLKSPSALSDSRNRRTT